MANLPSPAQPSSKRNYAGDYKPNILIVGQSGSGKTSSLRNLAQKDSSIHLIDMEHKGLPFKGRFTVTKSPTTTEEAILDLQESHSDPDCKIIIFEGITKFCEVSSYSCRERFSGYEIWNMHTRNIVRLLNWLKSVDKTIIATAIDDFLQVYGTTGGQTTVRRASVHAGKEWEGKIESQFCIVLFTEVVQNKTYKFLTNGNGIAQAKTPIGMFNDALIDNDVKMILEKMEQYYK